MIIVKSGRNQWQNRHEVFTQDINDLYHLGNENSLNALDGYNDTTRGIQQLIATAIAGNTTLRALGSGWSWTKIATTANGIMLDTKPLNTVFPMQAESIVPAYKGDISKLFFAQCGNGIWELSAFLRNRGLSLKTSGASNGQTIAGAIGTGAHGSAFDFGAVQDFVVGLHIVTGPDKHIYLERKSAPVASASLIQKLQTTLVQDDDLFNAALISMGCFGFIHGVMIETESLFLLECYLRRMPYDATLKKMMETLDFSAATTLPCGNERPFHFAIQLNPYDMDKGAYVTTMYKRPFTHDYQLYTDNQDGIGPGDDAACFVGRLTQALPALVPTLVNKLLAGALTPYEKKMGTLGEIFDNTTLHGKLLSAAIGIPAAQVNTVVDMLMELNKTNGPFTGLFAFRYVKKSNATLAFTRFDITCILELDAVFSDDTLAFYNCVWKKLEEANIPFTFHWGKMSEMDAVALGKKYDTALNSWLRARNQLLDAPTRKVFTNPIMQQWGLDKEI